MQRPRAKAAIGWLAIALTGLLAVLGGAVAVTAEQSHLLAAGFTPAERIALIASGERQIGMSSQTQRQFMVDCRNSAITAVQLGVPSAQSTALAQACERGARQVTDASPASSFGWFAQAHAALVLGDWKAMNAALTTSQATGANEGWIARNRVELVEDNRSRIDTAYMPRHLSDLRVLVSNMRSYQDFLARVFVTRPGSRAELTDMVETLPVQSQRIFLNAVERARQALATGKL